MNSLIAVREIQILVIEIHNLSNAVLSRNIKTLRQKSLLLNINNKSSMIEFLQESLFFFSFDENGAERLDLLLLPNYLLLSPQSSPHNNTHLHTDIVSISILVSRHRERRINTRRRWFERPSNDLSHHRTGRSIGKE